MYQNRNTRHGSSCPKKFGRPNNYHHYRNNQNSGNFSRRGKFTKSINPSLLVKKAEEFVKMEETQPTHSFTDFGFEPILVDNIKAKGFIKPTPIQDQVMELAMKGLDILGVANTGTGKTAAFALPLINKILKNPSERVIILAPTRELAQQIKQDIRTFTFGMKIYIALAIGGAYIREQIMDIRRDPHFIIGTPGRILDLGRRKIINFSKFNTLVLDEVDRMLDMGFINDIKTVIEQLPKNRQTLFFSATVDKKVEPLFNTFLNNPVKVSVKTQETSSHVEQNVIRVPRAEKEKTLNQLLKQPQFKKVLIFGGTKMIVDRITNSLASNGFNAGAIHSGKAQNKRQNILRSFKESRINILVATDVAARGLDIADITHVINYDMPANYEDYTHRIGRTGRGDATGFALTFIE